MLTREVCPSGAPGNDSTGRPRSSGLERVGQLEHIITEHVEIGLRLGKTAGKRREHNDPDPRFFRQELGKLLAQLDFGYDRPNPLFFYGRNKMLNVNGRRFAA